MSEVQQPTASVRPAPEGVALDGFEQLLAVGRQRGYLTQDDLILVLQAVELSHDIIEDVVERVRAEGIEYLEQNRVGAAPVALAEVVVDALPDNSSNGNEVALVDLPEADVEDVVIETDGAADDQTPQK